MADTSPRARCNRLTLDTDNKVVFAPCNIPFDQHEGLAVGGHAFEKRPKLKIHIPWDLFASGVVYCGRRQGQQSEMAVMGGESEPAIKRAWRLNAVCLNCAKNWMYVKERLKFLGRTW